MNHQSTRSLMAIISLFLIGLLPASVWASTSNSKMVSVDRISYELNMSDMTASVSEYNVDKSGEFIIPSSIVYEGDTYTVSAIQDGAFSNCILTTFSIPSSVTSIGPHLFAESYGPTSLIIDPDNEVYDSRDNCNAIIETSTNTLISGCSSTVIPNSVTSIGSYAFITNDLATIEIPSSVTRIGDYAFYMCKDLSSIIIPGSVQSIGAEAFEHCYALTSLSISEGVKTIGDYAFSCCYGVTQLNIPKSVTSIGKSAFYKCGLTSVMVQNETPIAYGNNIFEEVDMSNCMLLVPAGSKSAYEIADCWKEFGCINEYKGIDGLDILAAGSCGENAFYTIYSDKSMVISGTGDMKDYDWNIHINDLYYKDINTVVIKEGVTSIGASAFRSYENLTSISIPNTVTSIGNSAFISCASLTSIAIPNSVTSIGQSAFSACEGLISIDVPSSVITIGDYAFALCHGLTSVTIPNSVTTIGTEAFYHCYCLTSVTIPSSVTSIGNYAFAECFNLSSIIAEGKIPATINGSLLWSVDIPYCTLYVPYGSKSAYKSTSGWENFQNIVELDTDLSALTNAIYVNQTEGRVGGTMDIPVNIKSEDAMRGFEFSMELPEGATINGWALSEERLPLGASTSDKMASQKIEGNKITVLCTLNHNKDTFTGNDGEVATVNVTFADDMEPGEYPIYLTACNICDAAGKDNKVSDVKATLLLDDYVTGDANGDGELHIGDVTAILNYILGTASDGFNAKAADANGDGDIRIGDATAILNLLLNQ